ncbi:MAG: RagB/SusD family nutrient uptake outer membrane protein, partial [Hymenobacter sp.]
DNDMVHFRLPDVLLMKAEAIMRGGTATSAGTYGNTPLALVNSIRTDASRSAGALTSMDLNTLYAERGRELYLENWRRQDMVRFGKYLGPIEQGPTSSDAKYLIFPIPNQQLAVNPNLTQNPGY